MITFDEVTPTHVTMSWDDPRVNMVTLGSLSVNVESHIRQMTFAGLQPSTIYDAQLLLTDSMGYQMLYRGAVQTRVEYAPVTTTSNTPYRGREYVLTVENITETSIAIAWQHPDAQRVLFNGVNEIVIKTGQCKTIFTGLTPGTSYPIVLLGAVLGASASSLQRERLAAINATTSGTKPVMPPTAPTVGDITADQTPSGEVDYAAITRAVLGV